MKSLNEMTDREIIRSAVALTLGILREVIDDVFAPGKLPIGYDGSGMNYLELGRIVKDKIENERVELGWWDFDCPEILSHSSCGWRGWRQDLDGDRTICPRCGRKRDNVQENVTD